MPPTHQLVAAALDLSPLTRAEVCARLGVSEVTLRRWLMPPDKPSARVPSLADLERLGDVLGFPVVEPSKKISKILAKGVDV